METVVRPSYTDAQRMELRALVKLASEVVAPFWPFRTFVHHNVLHELEYLDFDAAVERAERVCGAQGYLPNEQYRAYVRRGQISPELLDEVLRPLAQDKAVTVGGREVSHLDVLRVHLLNGITAPSEEELEAWGQWLPDPLLLDTLIERLRGALPPANGKDGPETAVQEDREALGCRMTLADWCDRTVGTDIKAKVNAEMVKWCSAFLDEGQAAWPMPYRESGFYGTWKRVVGLGPRLALLGIADWRRKVSALPERPEDALLDSLALLAVPESSWQEYLALHLAALPGWAGFIKWRADREDYAWQLACPASLIKYLAVRLFYEREFVERACQRELGIAGDYKTIIAYMQTHPEAYYMRREWTAKRLPVRYGRQADRLANGRRGRDPEHWRALAGRMFSDAQKQGRRVELLAAAWRLMALAEGLNIAPAALAESDPEALIRMLGWLDEFPEARHGPYWLAAHEAGYQRALVRQFMANVRRLEADGRLAELRPVARPSAQVVCCIDVRSEVFRRHLEAISDYETFGFPGFFMVFIRYRPYGAEYECEQCPVILKARSTVREIPRAYHGEAARQYLSGVRLVRNWMTLFHDLKEHVITPYVTVEALGWLYSLPFIGKTLLPVWYERANAWLKRTVAPPVATTLSINKLSREEAIEILAMEQRMIVRQALREWLGVHGAYLTPELVEAFRRLALDGDESASGACARGLQRLGLSDRDIAGFVEILRRQHRLDSRWAEVRLERLTRIGLTLSEQVQTIQAGLTCMGLTHNFARLVLLLGHGSTSDNNPYESALDCGACGGGQGEPNARAWAAMANRPQVREELAKLGFVIPADTHFLAGQYDTTTDRVRLFDLEDVPPTHRHDLARLEEALKEAGMATSQERCARLPDAGGALTPTQAFRHVLRRGADWSQVRPEWGLSGNASIVVGRRLLTQGLNLEGRTFFMSYEYTKDRGSKLLEIILTAPLVVMQWINLEHYFSTVDNAAARNVFGSGSKAYHNVTGLIGVMYGTHSDLMVGLSWQTVMNGERPYHDPLRLLTIVEAPRDRISELIKRHEILQRLFDNRWVHLMAFEREGASLYRYLPRQGWIPERSTDHE